MALLRFLSRFRHAYRDLGRLAERETWPRSDIQSFQLERLNAVWDHAIRHVPYYRNLRAARRLSDHFETLEEYYQSVPLLTKEIVCRRQQDFLSEQADSGRWCRTGGSTGAPMNAYWSVAAHQEMLRTKYRFFKAWGLDIFDRVGYLWGHSASFAPGMAGRIAQVRQPLEDRLRNRMRMSAYHLGRDDLRRYLDQIARFRPACLYGYSTALYLLALEAQAVGFRCSSLRLLVLTGEPAFPHVVETLEREFGVPAVVEYGSIDCGHLANEWTDRTLRVREDVTLLETVPRDDGRHDIVVSVLNNPSSPLLRYAIGDVTDDRLKSPPRGFSILRNVLGRNNDFIQTRSGSCLHSARLDAFFKYECHGIRCFRVRQQVDGALAVHLEVEDNRFNIAATRDKLTALVEGFPVHIEIVPKVPQSPAGKHRLVVSELMSTPRAHRRDGCHGKPAFEGLEIDCGPPIPRIEVIDSAPLPLDTASRSPLSPLSKAAMLRQIIESPATSFLMEAHNGLSAKIGEEAGFEALWASGLSIAAAWGVRDSNEASWTQVLEMLEFMSDATRIPILVDGDTGYGNFNNMRRLVQKLEQRQIGGVCIEDKVFPKTNSLLPGKVQPLAQIDEFCGRIKAGKDARRSDDFVIVARIEAFIAGWGLDEALKRGEAYRRAGADAVLIHSAQRSPREVLEFKEAWQDRLPVIIVPTKYYSTPTEVFRNYGFSAIIWANHLMRSCIAAMQRTAQEIYEEQNLVHVEQHVAPLAEVFRLQKVKELEEAEDRYLPHRQPSREGNP